MRLEPRLEGQRQAKRAALEAPGAPGRGGAGSLLAPLLAVALGLGAAPASALSLADIAPLWFDGPSGWGFSADAVAAAGRAPEHIATPADAWWSAGGDHLAPPPQLVVSQQIVAIHQDPAAEGRIPSREDPVLVDAVWTVRNATGASLPSTFLAFVLADPAGEAPHRSVGLDGDLLSILEYSSRGQRYLFGAVELPALGVERSVDVLVRYVIGGALGDDAEHAAILLPELGVAGVSAAAIPEPGTASALLLGLAGLARWRRGPPWARWS